MKRVVSDRTRAANRRNAKKSTGPRTPRGKARAARNALKHGLLARDVVVNTPHAAEDAADFDALLADLLAELQPKTVVEETLVERIATCYWRLRRVQRLEGAAVRGALDAADPYADRITQTARSRDDTAAALRVERRLAELLDKPDDVRSPQESAEMESSLADFARVNALAALGISGEDVKPRIRQLLPDVVAGLERKLATLNDKLESAERDRAAWRAAHGEQASLPAGEIFLRILRFETLLDRQIHRALAELRRLRAGQGYVTRKNRTLPNEPD